MILLNAVTITGSGAPVIDDVHYVFDDSTSFQVTGSTTSGTGTATTNIEVSNDGVNYMVLGTVSLALGIATVTDGFVSSARWKHTRANVTAISGIGATITVTMET